MTDPVARKYQELRARVGEHLRPGETFRGAIWVTRATSRPSAGQVARQELGPKRLLESIASEAVGIDEASTGPDAYGDDRRGVLDGRPGSVAAQLDAQVPQPTAARALALTGDRLIVFEKTPGTPAGPSTGPQRSWLAKAGDLIRNRPSAEPLPPLVPRWEVPRRAVVSATVGGGRIHIGFGDGSSLSLVTPEVLAHRFVTALDH
ncbi:hypothetical protein ACIA5D_42090 [Actinoplanes sp. NPDC051513]|uniref:hypothetical protein n=1 Tax=Actinoplanes sp. NPDC051513 TaxID=3363908 RepID=UPI00378C459B